MSRNGWLPPGVTDADIDRAAPGYYDEQDDRDRYEQETNMSNSIDDVFESNTLKAADIKGREITATIAHVEPKEFTGRDNGTKTKKLMIYFEKAKKALVCNRTNAQRIAYIHGKDYSQWVGKQIVLYVDPFVQFGNELVEAIRIKPPNAVQEPPVQDRITSGPQPAPRKPEARYDNFDSPESDEIPF